MLLGQVEDVVQSVATRRWLHCKGAWLDPKGNGGFYAREGLDPFCCEQSRSCHVEDGLRRSKRGC